MLVPGQYFDVKITKKNIEYYKNLGYDVNLKDVITIPAEHLTSGSHQPVQVQCDVCKKEYPKPYKQYLSQHTYDMDTCNGCKNIKHAKTCVDKYGCANVSQVSEVRKKVEQTCVDRYGVINVMQNKEIEQKQTNTMFEKYGVKRPSQNQDIKEKIARTNLERYGVKTPSQNKDIQEKTKKTVFEKYGTECTLQNEVVKEKAKQIKLERYGTEYPQQNSNVRYKTEQTNIKKYGTPCILQNPIIKQKALNTIMDRYGVDCVLKSKEIQEKSMRTRIQSGAVPTSQQQKKLYNIIQTKYTNVELNYPFGRCALDILININGILIDVEYDCDYWHQDLLVDLKRDKFLQSNGFKTLRIRSRYKLPSEEQLFSAIDELITTNRMFKEIILPDWNPEQYKINKGQEVSA